MLNKTISLSIKFHQLPDDTCRLLATWIIPHLDKCGVFYGDAAVVKSLIFPMRPDVTVEQVREYLKAMQHAGLIVLFESGGRVWQHWTGFNHNQVGLRDDRETTEFAAPPATETDEIPKGDAGKPPVIQQDAGNLPANIRQTSTEKPAEKNRSEMNGIEGGAANAAPIIATIPATADVANSTDMNTPKVDAFTDYFNRATKAKTHRDTITAWRGAEHLKDVCIALCDATGLPVQKGDSGKWLKGATALYELGASADILRRVWNEATERDRQFMTHPAAFVERVRGALAAMHAQPTAPTRRIIDWQEQPDGSMMPIYEAVQA